MSNKVAALVVASITILVYFLTILPFTRSIANSLFVLYLVVTFFGLMYYPFARRSMKSDIIMGTYMLIIFLAVLFWIGVTGWFFSPFFYLLYLLAIVLAFVFSPFVTLVFIVVLLGLFSPNIGSIDITLDLITILSLFSVIPLTYFLQQEYLRLKEQENKVLILEEKTSKLGNKVDEVLRNKVSKFAVNLRQPVNDIRQMAIHAQKAKKDGMLKTLQKIADLGESSLKDIEDFETTVTGTKLVHTKNKKKSQKSSKKKK